MIIGITGQKKHGKDTFADYLVTHYNFKKITFAEPIKDICKILFNFTDEQLHGSQKEIIDKFWNITPRHTMQFIGTELFRNNINQLIPNINNDFWCKIMENKIANNLETNIVISDVRFQNEECLIHKFGGTIIKVINNNIINNDQHSSENDNIKYDYLIYNNNSINDYYYKINILLNKMCLNKIL